MMTAKMSRCDDRVQGRIRFNFALGDNVSEDVVFYGKAMETTDSSLLREAGSLACSECYDVRTNDCGYSAEGVWQPSEKVLVLQVGDTEPKKYTGETLDDCVKRAYVDGAFQRSPEPGLSPDRHLKPQHRSGKGS